jgi:hypothetical protein
MKRLYPLLYILFLIYWSCEEAEEPDTTPPVISSITIKDDNYLGVVEQEYSWESFDFTASVTDDGSGIDYVEAWINSSSLGKDYASPYAWDWSPTSFESEGTKVFKVKAYDQSGNFSEKTDSFSFLPLDNEAPTISNFTYSELLSIGNVEFEVTVTDNREVDYVKFYVGQIVTLYSGTDYFGIGDQYKISHWFYSWDDAGTYDVEVEAYDKKGNSSSKTYSYYYPG